VEEEEEEVALTIEATSARDAASPIGANLENADRLWRAGGQTTALASGMAFIAVHHPGASAQLVRFAYAECAPNLQFPSINSHVENGM
jgi:hypothetical protein